MANLYLNEGVFKFIFLKELNKGVSKFIFLKELVLMYFKTKLFLISGSEVLFFTIGYKVPNWL